MAPTRRPLVAGNWKMNGLTASVSELDAMLAGVEAGGEGGQRDEQLGGGGVQAGGAVAAAVGVGHGPRRSWRWAKDQVMSTT